MFVAKLNSNGNLQWSKYFGDDWYDYGTKIIETNNRGLAILGAHGIGPEIGATNDLFLVKLGTSGNLQWAKYYGGSMDDYPRSFIQNADGSYAIIGSSYSFRNDSYADFYTIKTNASGNVLLSKAVTGAAMVIFAYGSGYIMGGWDQVNFDGLLITTDNNFNTCNSRDVNTVSQVSTRGVDANFHNKKRTFTASALSFTSRNSSLSVSQLCTLSKTRDIAKPSEKDRGNFKISVYPNPVKDKMILQFLSYQSARAEIRILNTQGNIFFVKNISVYQGQNREIINTSFLNNGNYFLSMTLSNGDRKLIPFLKE